MDLVVVQQVLFGLSNGVGYAVFGLGLSLIFGVMGIINIAHGELYMLGAMVGYSVMTYLGMNYFAAAASSVALCGLVGIMLNQVVAQPLLGRSGFQLSIFLATLGVSMILLNGSLLFFGRDPVVLSVPFPEYVQVGDIRVTGARIVLVAVGAMVLFLFWFFLAKARMGKVMRATSQDMLGASLVGIDPRKVYALAFAIASGLAGLAGILLAPVWIAYPYMGQLMILKGFVVVIVGGLGSIEGAILAGLLLGLTESVFGHFVSIYYRDGFGYAIMLLVLLLRPKGLLGKV